MEINGQQVSEIAKFSDMDLSPEVMRAINEKNYIQTTPIQTGAIPYFMEWKDVIAKAPTGTGKTFAFGIPIIEHIDPESEEVQAVIMAPTRELAMQITAELRDLAVSEGMLTLRMDGMKKLERGVTTLEEIVKETAQ